MPPAPTPSSGPVAPPLPSQPRQEPPPLPLDMLDTPSGSNPPNSPYAPEPMEPKKTNYLPMIIILCVFGIVACIAYTVYQGSAIFKGVYGLVQVTETQTKFQMLGSRFSAIAWVDEDPTVETLLAKQHSFNRNTRFDGWNRPIKITITPDENGEIILMLQSGGVDKVMDTDDDLITKFNRDGDQIYSNFEETVERYSESMFNSM
ncbi:MAG: hypothetical protein HN909_01435 [Phycisphaerales bacterium]|jgi:hypothetical protein|nr:hypothetical protein [Phycisphaerales bacterium]MBT7170410.1 hypothetical protein [Phycisphaerales bacterium]